MTDEKLAAVAARLEALLRFPNSVHPNGEGLSVWDEGRHVFVPWLDVAADVVQAGEQAE